MRIRLIAMNSVNFCDLGGSVKVVVLLAVEVDVEVEKIVTMIDLRNVDLVLRPRNGTDILNHFKIG